MKKSLFENLPDIISAASKSFLGLMALVILAFSLIAFFFFKQSSDKIKMSIFLLLMLSFGLFIGTVLFKYDALISDRKPASVIGDSTKSETNPSIIKDNHQSNLNEAQAAETLRPDGQPYRNSTQEAQYLLRALGYNIRYPDGFEGPATTSAIEDFQRKHNLPISGAADNVTLSILRDRAKKSFLRQPAGIND